jgi:hypothetical protein
MVEWMDGGVVEWWSGGVEEWMDEGVKEWRSGVVETRRITLARCVTFTVCVKKTH